MEKRRTIRPFRSVGLRLFHTSSVCASSFLRSTAVISLHLQVGHTMAAHKQKQWENKKRRGPTWLKNALKVHLFGKSFLHILKSNQFNGERPGCLNSSFVAELLWEIVKTVISIYVVLEERMRDGLSMRVQCTGTQSDTCGPERSTDRALPCLVWRSPVYF